MPQLADDCSQLPRCAVRTDDSSEVTVSWGSLADDCSQLPRCAVRADDSSEVTVSCLSGDEMTIHLKHGARVSDLKKQIAAAYGKREWAQQIWGICNSESMVLSLRSRLP